MNVQFMNKLGLIRSLFKGEIMLTDKAKERIEVAVDNIMSGVNNCGTLANAALYEDKDYFHNAIVPVVAVYDAEYNQLLQERDKLSASMNDAVFIISYFRANHPLVMVEAEALLKNNKGG